MLQGGENIFFECQNIKSKRIYEFVEDVFVTFVIRTTLFQLLLKPQHARSQNYYSHKKKRARFQPQT